MRWPGESIVTSFVGSDYNLFRLLWVKFCLVIGEEKYKL